MIKRTKILVLNVVGKNTVAYLMIIIIREIVDELLSINSPVSFIFFLFDYFENASASPVCLYYLTRRVPVEMTLYDVLILI